MITYAVIDIETWGSKEFAFGVIYFPCNNEYKIFYDKDKLKNFILSHVKKDRNTKDNYVFMGHNISYDLSYIFGNVEIYFAQKFKFERYFSKGKEIFKKRYYIDNLTADGKFYYAKYYNLKFIDTFNLFPRSLKDAGVVVDLAKLQIDEDKFIYGEKGEITDDDIEYCKTDCKICFLLYKKMDEWIISKGGKMKLTMASAGLSILKFKNPIFIDFLKVMNKNKSLQKLDEFFRNAYYGGRTEVIKKTIKNAYYYDVNSLYPSVMIESYNYPDPRTLRECRGNLTTNILDTYEGVAEITVDIPDTLYLPPLPFRGEQKNIYPVGRGITGYWCFPEIRRALEMGITITDTKLIIIGDRIKSPFHDYVIDLYDERMQLKKKDSPLEVVVKLYLNSGGYGKFAQRNRENKLYSFDDCLDAGEVIEFRGERFILVNRVLGRSRINLLCLASYVTSHSRVILHEYFEKVDYDVVYADTDSIITTVKLNDKYVSDYSLGYMKLEHEIKFASFKGRKDYFIITSDNEAYLKRKGVSVKNLTHIGGRKITKSDRKKIQDNDLNLLKKIHYSDVITFNRILKSRESLRRGLEAGKIYEMEKERRSKIDGRVFSGKKSRPISFL